MIDSPLAGSTETENQAERMELDTDEQSGNWPSGNALNDECKDATFEMLIWIPGWATDCKLLVNGVDAGVDAKPGTFATINQSWKPGDTIELKWPINMTLMKGHPFIEEVRIQTAVKVGPVVYCPESTDILEGTSTLDVYLPSDVELRKDNAPSILGGITTLVGDVVLRSDQRESMYRSIGNDEWKNFSA